MIVAPLPLCVPAFQTSVELAVRFCVPLIVPPSCLRFATVSALLIVVVPPITSSVIPDAAVIAEPALNACVPFSFKVLPLLPNEKLPVCVLPPLIGIVNVPPPLRVPPANVNGAFDDGENEPATLNVPPLIVIGAPNPLSVFGFASVAPLGTVIVLVVLLELLELSSVSVLPFATCTRM